MIGVYYSGGAANSDPALSTGGARSSVPLVSQSATLLAAIPGVTILRAAGFVPDDGLGALAATLTVNAQAAGVDVTFAAYGFPAGVVTGAAGNYAFVSGAATTLDLYCGGAYLRVAVDPAQVSGQHTSALAAVGNPGALFPAILSHPSPDAYRCVFLVNEDAAQAVTVNVRVTRQGIGSTLLLAAANAAGSPTGTDPAALDFGPFASVALPASGLHALWLLRRAEFAEVPSDIEDAATLELELVT